MNLSYKEARFDPVSRLGLVWCNPHSNVRDWIKYLLQRVPVEDVAADAIPMPKPGYVYIIESSGISLDDLAEKIRPHIESNRPIGLIHLSDEWYAGNYQSYCLYDFVIRTYHAKRLEKPGVLVVPLGWPDNNGGGVTPAKLATERPINWFFAGYLKTSRFELVRAFKSWQPNVCRVFSTPEIKGGDGLPWLGSEEYVDLLNNSVFCPAPMGNVNAETWRLYEALEAGCIPLAERRLTMDYYSNLFGKNPIPRFKRWREARAFAENLATDPRALVDLQAEIQQWWSEYKCSLTKRVKEFVLDGLRGSFRRKLGRGRFPSGRAAKIWQRCELVRHQSVGALSWRIRTYYLKGYRRHRRCLAHDDAPLTPERDETAL